MIPLLCLEEEYCCCCCCCWTWKAVAASCWRVCSFPARPLFTLLSCCFKTTMKFWLHCCSSDHGAADVGLVSVSDGVQGHQLEALTWVMEWAPQKKNTKKILRNWKERLSLQSPQWHLKAVFRKIKLFAHESIAVRGSWHVTTSEEFCVKT